MWKCGGIVQLASLRLFHLHRTSGSYQANSPPAPLPDTACPKGRVKDAGPLHPRRCPWSAVLEPESYRAAELARGRVDLLDEAGQAQVEVVEQVVRVGEILHPEGHLPCIAGW